MSVGRVGRRRVRDQRLDDMIEQALGPRRDTQGLRPDRSLRCEFAGPAGSGDPAVHEEVAAGDERAIGPDQQRTDTSAVP